MSKDNLTRRKTCQRSAQEQRWLRENAKAIAAHNERIARDGPLLEPYWAERSED